MLPVRVYFEDTDFSGLVYHATYLRWCERGRSDFLRLMGNDHQALIAGASGREPAAFVVRRMHLEYLKPARIDEVLEVTTRAKASTAATLTLDQRVSRGGVELFTAEVMVVLISASRQAAAPLHRPSRGLAGHVGCVKRSADRNASHDRQGVASSLRLTQPTRCAPTEETPCRPPSRCRSCSSRYCRD